MIKQDNKFATVDYKKKVLGAGISTKVKNCLCQKSQCQGLVQQFYIPTDHQMMLMRGPVAKRVVPR